MKKLLFITLAIVISMAANAQNQVWDGTAEPWTHGSGTEEDPYLIETPQNLAYLSLVIEDRLNIRTFGEAFQDTCFKMTADFDLGGDNGLRWRPIGLVYDGLFHSAFSGIFDGNGHVVKNMNVNDTTGTYFNHGIGLFGFAMDATIKNITICGCLISHESGLGGDGFDVGGLLGRGNNVNIENCHNASDVSCRVGIVDNEGCTVGGIAGRIVSSTVTNCSNSGNINNENTVLYGDGFTGGIVGSTENCDLTLCSNTGDVNADVNPRMNGRGVFSGGIVGFCVGDLHVAFCFNTADISSANLEDERLSYSGGIVGGVEETSSCNVSNSYNAGNLMAYEPCGIVSKTSTATAVYSSYFLENNNQGNGFGEPQTEGFMKSAEFVSLLNAGGEVFAMDTDNVNGGFPVFADGGHFNVIENQIDGGGVSAYPNPAAGSISVVVNSGAEIGSVSLFDISGRLVKAQQSGFGSIDISGLATGMYVMKVTLDDGKVFEEKIVKK